MSAVAPESPPAPASPLAAPPVAPRPARKWLGRKGGLLIVLAGAVLWFGTVTFGLYFAHAPEAPTLGLLIGGFTVAVAFIYTMAYRLRPTDGLGVTRLLVAFAGGGLLAATLAAPIDRLVEVAFAGTTMPVAVPLGALSLAGVIEEFVKIWIVVLMARGLRVRTARNGLFLGAAVGFGFAGFENIGYARDAWNSAVHAFSSPFGPEAWVVISRDILGIFGHPLFTGLLAAAVFAAVRHGRFRLTWGIVFAYLGVALAHGLFDAGGEFVYEATSSRVLGTVANWTIYIALAVVFALLWRVVSRRANASASDATTAMLAESGDEGDASVLIDPTATEEDAPRFVGGALPARDGEGPQ